MFYPKSLYDWHATLLKEAGLLLVLTGRSLFRKKSAKPQLSLVADPHQSGEVA